MSAQPCQCRHFIRPVSGIHGVPSVVCRLVMLCAVVLCAGPAAHAGTIEQASQNSTLTDGLVGLGSFDGPDVSGIPTSRCVNAVKKRDLNQLAGRLVQALIGRDQPSAQVTRSRQVEGVIVRQASAVRQFDGVVKESFRWSHPFQLNAQEIAEGALDIARREVAFESQSIADFVQEEIGSDQQEVAAKMALSQVQRLIGLGLFEKPFQCHRGVNDRDHRASRIFRSASTLLNPRSGCPQRLRNSSMWRAALRIASRSRRRDLSNSSTVNFDDAIVFHPLSWS